MAIGLGCHQDCPAEALLALIEASLAQHGLTLDAVSGLASIDKRRQTPGLLQLAGQLQLPLVFFSAAQLQAFEPQLTHRSALTLTHTGCYGVAESAALALASQLGNAPARLLIEYRKTRQATFALAISAFDQHP
ncbi:cobalamin biosynthesis protein [Pseudomonas sp. 21LCFQ010]|uniref:cobalamin biosynthesis protein n=1 Tax=unclassified Pseudomonas TaxID=196821 RepID=UPI0004F6FD76|nr:MULTISPECIES: cobalamin biosynthesis protein [unclassified Pseudomonas]MCO8161899.1 cobalamin biosynthesis protein [Pseudomonas sp. 21LCFQ010]BAP45036.1 cobalamin biosynthesis protein [Pseudomonas sp. StFLB209]